MRIKDICSGVTDGSHNPPQGLENSDYLMLSSKNVFDDKITFDSPRYLSQIDFEQESKRTRIKSGDVCRLRKSLTRSTVKIVRYS